MINNVVLVGRLTKDADLKYTNNGAAVATFPMAVQRSFTNQSGQREADFVNCVIWRKQAETLSNFTRKGSLIGVEGRIQTRNYENQQGHRVYVTEVVCDNFQMLESKSVNEERPKDGKEPQSDLESEQRKNRHQSYTQPPIDGLSDKGFNTNHFDPNDSDYPF